MAVEGMLSVLSMDVTPSAFALPDTPHAAMHWPETSESDDAPNGAVRDGGSGWHGPTSEHAEPLAVRCCGIIVYQGAAGLGGHDAGQLFRRTHAPVGCGDTGAAQGSITARSRSGLCGRSCRSVPVPTTPTLR